MVKFCCSHCGQGINVPEIHAGKKGRCPRCKNIVVVPKAGPTGSISDQSKHSDVKRYRSSSSPDQVEREREYEMPSQCMLCPNCGFSNIKGASFCSNCGKELDAEIICDNCGAKLEPNAKFCGECGAQQPMNVGRRGQEKVDIELAEKAKYKNPHKLIFPSGQMKSPLLAACLNLLLGGLGQIYIGQVGLGILILIWDIVSAAPTFGFMHIVVIGLSAVGAYQSARKLNSGEPIYKWSIFSWVKESKEYI